MIRMIAKSTVLKNYAGAIAILLGALPAVGSLVVSIVTAYRGEPFATRSWDTLKKQVDEQTSVINLLNLKLIKMEATQEGLQIGKLQAELEALQKQYERMRKDRLKEKAQSKKPSLPSVTEDRREENQKIEESKRLLQEYLKQQKMMKKKDPPTLKVLPPSP